MAPTVTIQSELERWFYNHRELSLNERINNRDLFRNTHYLLLGLPLPALTKNEIGELVTLSRRFLKNPQLPKYLKSNCEKIIAQRKKL